MIKVCKNCGIEYTIDFYRKDESKFCSKKCMNEHRSNKIKVKCSYCEVEFTRIKSQISNNNFCSRSCYYKYKDKKDKIKCDSCGEIFIKKKNNSSNPTKRFKEHMKYGVNKEFKKDISKYSPDSFKMEILKEFEIETDAIKFENEKILESTANIYNIIKLWKVSK
jgi:hypothetical protein